MKEEKIVYKYRQISNEFHRDTLLKNELYLASPRDFNDPFDVVNVDNFYLLLKNKEGLRLFLEYCKFFFIDNYEEIGNNIKEFLIREFDSKENLKNKIIEAYNFCFGDFFLNKKVSNFDNVLEYKANIDDFLFRLIYVNNEIYWACKRVYQYDLYGILSLSKVIDNILMWSHYGENHRGFAIGFDAEKLEQTKDFLYAEDAKYTNDFPQVNPLEDYDFKQHNPFLLKNKHNKFVIYINRYLFLEIFYKWLDWQSEEEYRCAKIFSSTPTIKERIYTYDKSIIKEVVLGYGCFDGYTKDLIEYCRDNNIPMYRMTPIKNKFELTKEIMKI